MARLIISLKTECSMPRQPEMKYTFFTVSGITQISHTAVAFPWQVMFFALIGQAISSSK